MLDELDLISRLSSINVTEQLWHLLCSLVQADYSVVLEDLENEKKVDERNPRKKGSPTCTNADRCTMYAEIAEDVLDNYGDTKIGAFILRKFNPDYLSPKPSWPTDITTKWYNLKNKCRLDLQRWLKKGGKKYFTKKEAEVLSNESKVLVYIGSQIMKSIHEADTMANTHLNKHWPYEFKSGQSPTGIITIRK